MVISIVCTHPQCLLNWWQMSACLPPWWVGTVFREYWSLEHCASWLDTCLGGQWRLSPWQQLTWAMDIGQQYPAASRHGGVPWHLISWRLVSNITVVLHECHGVWNHQTVKQFVQACNKVNVKTLLYRLFVRGIHKGPIMQKAFPCHEVFVVSKPSHSCLTGIAVFPVKIS